MSIDFIIGLLISKGCLNIVVLIDRLSKRVIVDGLDNIEACRGLKTLGFEPLFSKPSILKNAETGQLIYKGQAPECLRLCLRRDTYVLHTCCHGNYICI